MHSPPPAEAAPIRPGFSSNTLAANDDSSTGLVPLGFGINFYGFSFDSVYVNNNGNVTFDEALEDFTPFDLTATGRQIIAPFFADVDTRGPGSGLVTYGAGTVDGRNVFGVNWIDVGYFNSRVDKLNSFQLILTDRSDISTGDFDIEFNYERIVWETGEASLGVDGLGGASARVGFSNGSGMAGTFFEFLGSGVNGAFLDTGPASTALVRNMANSDLPGRYILQARGGTIERPVVIPVPATLPLLLAGLSLLTLRAHRRTGA